MPTYQYVCNDCGEPLEVVQKFSDDALTVCPKCQGELRKVFSAVGIVFKGSGFYRTDNRSSSSTAPASTTGKSTSETASSNGSTSSSTTSSDSSSASSSSASTTSSSSTESSRPNAASS